MKIKELIEELNKFDKEMQICCRMNEVYTFTFDLTDATIDKENESVTVDVITI